MARNTISRRAYDEGAGLGNVRFTNRNNKGER